MTDISDDERDAPLAAAKARYEAFQARLGAGCGVVLAMAGKDRMAKCRARKRDRLIHLEFDVSAFVTIDGLIRRRLISDEASRNKEALNRAVARFLTEELKKP